MAAKIVPIPAHITDTGDKDSYYNQVNISTSNFATISRSVDNMVVSNISLGQLKSLLSAAFDVKAVCISSNVNSNSYYRPNGSSPYRMGDFAGYNHYAMPPTYYASKTSTMSLNIQEDGASHKVVFSRELRRGEKLPSYSGGGSASWSGIKMVVKVYEYTDPFPGTLLQTITATGIDVTRMFSSTIQQIDIPLSNTNEDYYVEVTTYYTYNTVSDVAIEDTHQPIVMTVNRYYPYSLYTNTSLWLVPQKGDTTWIVNVKNDAPDLGNSESYSSNFRARIDFLTEVEAAADYRYGYSSNVLISPQETEQITITWDSALPNNWDTANTYTITLDYKNDSGTWAQLDSRTWNP